MKVDVMDDFYKLLHPCMTILVVSISRDGKPNVMTCAWNMPVSEDPPMIAVAFGGRELYEPADQRVWRVHGEHPG